MWLSREGTDCFRLADTVYHFSQTLQWRLLYFSPSVVICMKDQHKSLLVAVPRKRPLRKKTRNCCCLKTPRKGTDSKYTSLPAACKQTHTATFIYKFPKMDAAQQQLKTNFFCFLCIYIIDSLDNALCFLI